MEKLRKNSSKGITLIALVITIIVLLILAAVSIATLTGENGILTKAQDANKQNTQGGEKEQIQLAYDVAMSDNYANGNYGTGVTREQLETELQKYDSKITVVDDGENLKVTFPSGNVYIVKKDGTIEGPTNKQGDTPIEEKLAKDILKIDLDAVEDYKKSPYVTYNNILCRVFYNDEKHGLQIISADNIKTKDIEGNEVEEKITLGKDDSNVQASDFVYEESVTKVDDNFRKAAASYNKVVDTLNKKAKEYLLETDKQESATTKIAIDARSLGSIAELKDEKFQGGDRIGMWPADEYQYLTTYGWNSKFKNTDGEYKDDANYSTETPGQLQKLGLNASSTTWLASRYMLVESDDTNFNVRVVYSNGQVYISFMCRVHSDGSTESDSNSNGFRPVFLLSSNVKIKNGGDGTSTNPYELEI